MGCLDSHPWQRCLPPLLMSPSEKGGWWGHLCCCGKFTQQAGEGWVSALHRNSYFLHFIIARIIIIHLFKWKLSIYLSCGQLSVILLCIFFVFIQLLYWQHFSLLFYFFTSLSYLFFCPWSLARQHLLFCQLSPPVVFGFPVGSLHSSTWEPVHWKAGRAGQTA